MHTNEGRINFVRYTLTDAKSIHDEGPSLTRQHARYGILSLYQRSPARR